MKRHLYTLDCYHRATGHTHRWYLCAGSQGYQSRSDDDPASVTFLPLVSQWASVTVRASGDGDRPSIDDLKLVNVRGDGLARHASVFDVTATAWLRVALGERPLNPLVSDYVVRSIAELELEDGAPLSSAVTVWRAKAGMLALGRTELRLPVWDRQTDFDTPILVEKYAGTGGLEGPANLKDVTKERCFGHRLLVAPTYLGVIAGKHTYSVNGGHPIEAVVAGQDKGAVVTLVSGTPAAGQFSVDVSTGIITIGGSKPEDFRVEVKGDKTGGVWRRYPGAIIQHLAVTHGALATTATVAGIDSTPRTVGLYLPAGDTTTHRAAYDKLVGSVARGRWYIDLTDQLVVTRLPRAAAVTTTRTYRRATGQTPGLKPTGSRTLPAKQVVVRWGENPGATSETASSATADAVALWSQQWREAASDTVAAVAAAWDAAAKVAYVETALTLLVDATAEAAAWLAEKSDPPQAYELPVLDGAAGVWIGGGVTVEDDVAGFETGATVVVTGRTNRDRGGGATLLVER